MDETTANAYKQAIKDATTLAATLDGLGLENEAYNMRRIAVNIERSHRKAVNDAKRANGEATRGRPPKAKA